jgi:predicted PurR-regulated permease PerM
MTAAASQALVYSSAAALVAVLVFLLWYALDYVLLAFLGVLLALLLSGLLYFVPYLGAIASAIPAILIGLSVSGQMAAYVVLLFAGLHAVEGYLVEPLIQRKAVYLPPALILFSQVLLALLGGPLGLVVATPLAAALVVAVKMLYVEDVVERTRAQPSPGETSTSSG